MKKILHSILMGIALLFALTVTGCEAGLQSNSGSGSQDESGFSFSDMYTRISTMQQEINSLNQKIQTLEQSSTADIGNLYATITDDISTIDNRVQSLEAINNGLGSRVINVTVHENSVRRALSLAPSITLEDFVVEKKSPTSYLLIQGTVSGHGPYSGDMQQAWKYGSGSEVLAQSVMYDNTNYSKIYSTTAVISGHGTTGHQQLQFRYYANNGLSSRPFNTYNPDSSTEPRMNQTKSVYIIWEIEP
ncbi:MAG: hypothetical protein GY754_37650 [bacterium]|nr:hypothetical protein [bacterium]